MALIYKTLYEVKLMHEYYLTRQDGQQVFSLPGQQQRLQFLQEQFRAGALSISNDLRFEFPEHLKSLYEGYHLRLLPAYSGFKLAVRVNGVKRNDGSLVYKPLVPMPGTMAIQVLAKKKGSTIDRISNGRINRNFSSIYLFTNEQLSEARQFPFLSEPVPGITGGYVFEQGELASFGTNDIRFFFSDGLTEQWSPVSGTAFANEKDRLLLPPRFDFFFQETDDVSEAVFTLRKKDGTSIRTITVSQPEKIRKAGLDFSGATAGLQRTAGPLSNSLMQLEVSGSNGYFKTFSVLLDPLLYAKENWALISIDQKPSDPFFQLFTNEGYLKKMRSPLGVWEEAPVFEIPVKSVHPFWRFIHNRGKELKLIPALVDYLNKEDKVLLSKRPRALARSYFFLQKEGGPQKKYLPNPVNYDLKKDEKQRWCLDVMVPQSELFPVI